MSLNYSANTDKYERTSEITEPQKKLISDIEKYLGISFPGGDVREAGRFIGQYKRKMESVKANG